MTKKGYKQSEEHKRKVSKARKGMKFSEKHKHKLSKAKQNMSEETKLKMSKAKKGNQNALGNKLTEETRRKMSESRKGHKYSEETKRKMSNAQKGHKSHNWKGGISFGQYCPRFNNKIKEETRNRYNYECFECGISEKENGRKLDIHHVDFNKEQGCNEHEWRLIPLCRSCHMKTNHNRKQSEYHFKTILEVI